MTETVLSKMAGTLDHHRAPLHRIGGPLVIAACIMISSPLRAEDCGKIAANANIVEVSVDKQKLSGSGVLLTYDGHVVTAAHILIGGIKPPIPLRYFVRLLPSKGESAAKWRGASLRKLDKQSDLAVLKLDELPKRPSLVASAPSALPGPEIGEVCLSGFGLRKDSGGAIIRLGFASIKSKLLPNEAGYLIADKKVHEGYSGGGMFQDGRFLGLILRRRFAGGSYVMPGSYVLDFTGSLGIFLDDENQFTPGVPPQALRKETQGNRRSIDENSRQIARVLRSMEWEISLRPAAGDDFKIMLKPRRAFPDQILDGFFVGDLTVHFDDDGFRQRLQSGGNVHQAVVAAKITSGEVLIESIQSEIAEIKGKYLADGLQLENANVSKLIVAGKINYHGWSRELISKELNVE